MKNINGKLVCESLDEMIAAKHTAILSVDIQNDFCSAGGHFDKYGKDLSSIATRLPAMVSFIHEAQGLNIPVIFIRQITMPNGHSDSPAWLRFKTRDGKSPDYTLPGTWGWEFVDGLTPGPNDTIIEKTRSDSFINTHLDRVLRARGIQTVVVLGVITEGCVESTVRSASHHDYYTVVVEDAVSSVNRDRHEASMGLFRARYPLASTDDILAIWREGKS